MDTDKIRMYGMYDVRVRYDKDYMNIGARITFTNTHIHHCKLHTLILCKFLNCRTFLRSVGRVIYYMREEI